MNYIKIDQFSLRNYYYAFLDTPEHLADQLFIQHQVRVYFETKELQHPSKNYVIIFCHIRKRDEARFLDALHELPDKMLLMGYTDYQQVCDEMTQILQ